MSVGYKLNWDVTDADTRAASANVGAHVRAGVDGTLIGSKNIAAADWLNTAAVLHDGSGTAITSTGGALDVNLASVNFTYDYAEDSAHASGDIGAYVLAVRQDTLAASTDTDGDYASFKVNAAGALYIDGSNYTQPVSATQLDIDDLNATDDAVQAWTFDGTGNAITSSAGALDVNIQSTDIDLNVSDISNTAVASDRKNATTTAAVVVTSPLANRKKLFITNRGNKVVHIGESGIDETTVFGYPVDPYVHIELAAGPSLPIYMRAESGTQEMRTLELS